MDKNVFIFGLDGEVCKETRDFWTYNYMQMAIKNVLIKAVSSLLRKFLEC
jgi:hypothetical protein